MPSLHRLLDLIFHLKPGPDTMTDNTFKATHNLEWRYKDKKPLTRALETFGFKAKDIKYRVGLQWILVARSKNYRMLNLGIKRKQERGILWELNYRPDVP